MKLSFGSGNASSGTHLHQENWHFIDVARDSFFAQSHLCLMESLIPEERTAGKGAYSEFLTECRTAIDAEPEDDITSCCRTTASPSTCGSSPTTTCTG